MSSTVIDISGSDDDKKVKVSSGDTLAKFLSSALDSSGNVKFTVLNPAGDEKIMGGVDLSGLEPAIGTKNTAFNKNFGSGAGEVAQGNDTRIVNGQTAYTKRISGISITGTTTKTIVLTLADGTTVSGSFTDISSTDGGGTADGNDFISGGSFDTATGVITLNRTDGISVTFDIDGRYEPIFTKNTAFNKNFGTVAGTVAEGNHGHSEFSTFLPLTGGTLTGQLNLRIGFTKALRFLNSSGTELATMSYNSIFEFISSGGFKIVTNAGTFLTPVKTASTGYTFATTEDVGTKLTADQKAALDSSDTPSGSNPYATIKDISDAGGDTKQVRVSGTDTTESYLKDALSDNGNVKFSIINPGANEQISASVDINSHTHPATSITTADYSDLSGNAQLVIQALRDKIQVLQNFVVSDNTNIDTFQEAVNQIEFLLYEVSIRVKTADVINTFSQTTSGKVLDGRAGKTLNDQHLQLKDAFNNHNHTGVYEPAFTKNTAFNKNFGSGIGQVAEGVVVASKADKLINQVTKSAGDFLSLSDSGKLINMNLASEGYLYIPDNSSVNFPIGTQILVTQTGVGQIVLERSATGVISNSPNGLKRTRTQNSSVALIKTGVNDWLLAGDLG